MPILPIGGMNTEPPPTMSTLLVAHASHSPEAESRLGTLIRGGVTTAASLLGHNDPRCCLDRW